MPHKITPILLRASALCLLSGLNPLRAADTAAAPATAPAASVAPAAGPNGAPPAAGRRGGRGPAVPMTDAEKAEIAKLADLPPWKPGAGDGDFRIGPDYPAARETLHPLKAGVVM